MHLNDISTLLVNSVKYKIINFKYLQAKGPNMLDVKMIMDLRGN